MHFSIDLDVAALGDYIPKFFALVGEERWFKRVDQLDREQSSSPFLRKIVADYHWLEMEISYQSEVLKHHGSLDAALVSTASRVALQFAAIAVEIHNRLGPRGRRAMIGRLASALKAETGFAALYLELDLAYRLIFSGYEVDFPDMEGTDQYDLAFRRQEAIIEVECKSLSADAGRKIHRKDFYRFMESIRSAFTESTEKHQILSISLKNRFPSKTAEQQQLRNDINNSLRGVTPPKLVRPEYVLELEDHADRIPDLDFSDEKEIYRELTRAFGSNSHVSGLATPNGSLLVIMRCEKEDDPSAPLLEAMREAASQLSGKKPSFIAVQFQELKPEDLMLPHLRRRVGILSQALFEHYGQKHINSTYFCGYGAATDRNGQVEIPAISVLNPQPRYVLKPEDATTFLAGITDSAYTSTIEPTPDST